MHLNLSQRTRLWNLLSDITKTNPYFKSLVQGNTEDIDQFYQQLPVIKKSTILDNLSQYISCNFSSNFDSQKELLQYFLDTHELSHNHDRVFIDKNNKKWILETTTGSTGKPFTVLKAPSEKLVESKNLFDLRKQVYNKATVNNGFLLLQPVDKYLKELSYRGNNDENIPFVFQHLLECKPEWILTTTLLLRRLYKYIRENNRFSELDQLNIRFIETTSQALDNEEKREISKAFHARLVNQFGCREVWNIAYECTMGHLHVNDHYLIVDIVDDEGRIVNDDGISGHVVLTSFIHKNFPFIKYYLGDRAYILKEPCACGLQSPRICFEGGRNKDKLINTPYYGTEIFRKLMRFMYFKNPELHIGRVKIIQDQGYSLQVYAEVDENKRESFKEIFLKTQSFLVEGIDKFTISFHYTYNFADNPKALKEEIFENHITRGK
jgi:phenylacetate-CoA ligase